MVVNTLSNMYAKAYKLPEIKLVNQPFTYTVFQEGESCWKLAICASKLVFSFTEFDFSTFGGSMFIGFIYMFTPLMFAMELIEDREVISYFGQWSVSDLMNNAPLKIRAKNQLRVNGLSFGIYYGSFFTVLCGMMFYVLVALLA